MRRTMFLLASLLYIVAPIAYIWGVVRGGIDPNPATWGVWAMAGGINAISYFYGATDQDRLGALLGFISAVVLMLVFVISLFLGRFSWSGLGWAEFVAIGFVVVTATVYVVLRHRDDAVKIANYSIQASLLVGFVPTWWGLWIGNAQEQPAAWVCAALAYALQMIGLRIGRAKLSAYVWPAISMVANGLVAYFAIWG